MLTADIANLEADTVYMPKVELMIDLAIAIGDGAAVSNFLGARAKLNQIAAVLGMPTFNNYDSAATVRTKINNLKNAIGMGFDLDYYVDFRIPNLRDGNTPETIASNLTDTHPAAHLMPDKDGNYVSKAINDNCRQDGVGLQATPSTRTNSLRNNSMAGVVAGNPGTLPTNWIVAGGAAGLSREIIGSGTANGLPYFDVRFFGTTSGAGSYGIQFEGSTQIVAASAQVWASSVFASVIAGSQAGLSSISFRGARGFTAGAVGTADTTQIALSAIDATMRRFEQVITLADATTVRIAPQFLLMFGAGANIDITFRIWAPQLELGAFVSPPILTSAAAVARTGNQQVITGLSALLAAGPGIGLFIKFNLPGIDSAVSSRIIEINDASGNNRIGISNVAGQFQLYVYSGNVAYANINLGAYSSGIKTLVLSVGTNFAKARIVGGSDPAADVALTLPIAPDRIALGGTGYNTGGNGYQITEKLGVKYGVQNQASFDTLYAMALTA